MSFIATLFRPARTWGRITSNNIHLIIASSEIIAYYKSHYNIASLEKFHIIILNPGKTSFVLNL